MPFEPKTPQPGPGLAASSSAAGPGPGPMVFGIDPGGRGALAAMNLRGEIVGVWDWPGGARETWQMMAEHNLLRCELVAMEAQHGFALARGGQIHPMQSAKTNFALGQNYGIWQGLIAVLGWPLEIISTASWRKAVLDSAVPKKPTKADIVAFAGRRWPAQTWHKTKDGRAEAACLAEYARQQIIGRRGGNDR